MEIGFSKLQAEIGLLCAVIGVSFCSILGGWDVLLKVLVLAVCLDYLSGMLAAYIERAWNSEVGFRGIAKKIFIFIMVALAYHLDLLLNMSLLRAAAISFYIGMEGLSILENAGRANLPVPKPLLDALEKLKDTTDKEVKSQ